MLILTMMMKTFFCLAVGDDEDDDDGDVGLRLIHEEMMMKIWR